MNLIGKNATVTESANKELIGTTGIITDETKNTITMSEKKLIKDQITITINGQEHKITSKTPSERIKVRT